MEWLNENSGVLVLVFSVIAIALIVVCICVLLSIHGKIITQKLKFRGFYSVNRDTKKRYAELIIGNKSINDIGLDELGIQNGKVNYPLTDEYRSQKSLQKDAAITLEQRNSLSFELTCEQLRQLVLEKNGKKILKTLNLYAVDTTGTLYRGKISAVRKLMREMLTAEKTGISSSAFSEVTFPVVAEPTETPACEEVVMTNAEEVAIADSAEEQKTDETVTEE